MPANPGQPDEHLLQPHSSTMLQHHEDIVPGMIGRHNRQGLRICYLFPGFCANDHDWCIPVMRNLVAATAEHHRAVVYTMHYPYVATSYRAAGADVHCLSNHKAHGLGRIALWRRLLKRAASDHQREPFDIVHAFWASETGYVASMLARDIKRPLVVSIGGGELANYPAERYGSQRSAVQRHFVRQSLERAAVVTAGSDWVARLLPPSVAARAVRLPLGVDTRMFAPGALRRGHRLAASASMIALKDYPTLLRGVATARREIPDLTLDIAGDGVERPAIEQLIGSLELREAVRLHGLLPHDAMPEFYRRADRLVHASLYESQGMAILEALATGLGVIATDVGIAAELPGPLVFGWQPRDHDALARAIVRSCRGTEHAAAALSDGPALVAGRYSVPVARAAFETIYDGLITGR